MKERPILFSAPMVQAILAGNKTQTRRVVKYQVEGDNCTVIKKLSPPRINVRDPRFLEFCPYGKVGNSLWVRETYCLGVKEYGEDITIYKADIDDQFNEFRGLWRPSIFMPRKYSRILLEITNVRVERLHDISEQDAIAEGCDNSKSEAALSQGWYEKPVKAFFRLWESINGRESLESNPWVWVITFKVVELKQ